MSKKAILVFVIILYILSSVFTVHCSSDNERKSYIVYMGELSEEASTLAVDEHHSLLVDTIGDEQIARESKIHSYGRSFNAFAARLLPHEAQKILENENVVSVFPNTMRKLHTTRSWDFLGFSEALSVKNSKAESNIIIALFDTGIWVDTPSFNDKGYGPPPSQWKGKCQKGANFTGCNNKVIGAQYYNLDHDASEEPTPVDQDGHGTHTSSTAAGSVVNGASLYGIAKGKARGGVPSARIAMYKVCWTGGCSDINLLAAFDDAIADGVDVISISVGGFSSTYFEDPIAIGAFHSERKGILTSCSAGNTGYEGTVQNVAPWILTVGASSIDRKFETPVMLGNGMKTSGISVNTFSLKNQMFPLTSGALAGNLTGDRYANISACDTGSLIKSKVKGKIVYCLGLVGQDWTIKELGGVGTILALDAETDIAFTFLIPAAPVSQEDGKKIDQYINSTKNAQATILKTRTTIMKAPFVATFSSRGPQSVNKDILKPDIVAPGLDILAAYSKLTSLTGDSHDKRHGVYNIISGTSMSCPHAAAAAAYVKTFHPNWSPAAIKSALMTTATPMEVVQPDAELGSGSGQINPVEAKNPGLIYDISRSAYFRFLCREGYNSSTIALLTGGKRRYNCSSFRPPLGTDGLNYPSMHVHMKTPKGKTSATFYRRVTNVGPATSIYKARVTSPKGVSVKVVPDTLSFRKVGDKQNFKVFVNVTASPNENRVLSASLQWTDSKHVVKSPILVYWPKY